MDTLPRQPTASTKFVIQFMLVVLLASAAILFFTRESYACSFTPVASSPLQELLKSSHVFAGKVVAVHRVPDDKVYEFRVIRVWNGPLYETTFVLGGETARAGTSCSDKL